MAKTDPKQELARRQAELAERRAALAAEEAELRAAELPVIREIAEAIAALTAQAAELKSLAEALPPGDLLAQSVAAGLTCLEQAEKQAAQRIAHADRQAAR
ncbi:MAG: hypothetical protein VX529_11770 [Pseudomonadota bacterium]|nr:hypothetical protein [Pseudomonadota bacterium]